MEASLEGQGITRGPRRGGKPPSSGWKNWALPSPPEPFGTYGEAVKTGNLLFLPGIVPTEGRAAKFIGWVGGSLMWKAKQLNWRRPTSMLLRDSTWARSTE